MQDAKTYRQYAEDCRRLARSMPEHRAKLLDMASMWADLASRAEATERDVKAEKS
jgi:hypothetical protein